MYLTTSPTTCHLRIMPCVKFLKVQISPENTKSTCHMAHLGTATCHDDVIMTYYWHHLPRQLYDLWPTDFDLWLFICLTLTSDRDIFCIQREFSKPNISLESTQRALCNGVGFIQIRELQILSFLDPFWIIWRVNGETWLKTRSTCFHHRLGEFQVLQSSLESHNSSEHSSVGWRRRGIGMTCLGESKK